MMTFTSEEEWQSAYDAAERELWASVYRGDIEWPAGTGSGPGSNKAVIRRVAQNIATAVIRSQHIGEGEDADITTVKGIAAENAIDLGVAAQVMRGSGGR